MRIALIYQQMIRDKGGLERYLHEFAGQLKKRGHQLHLVASKIDDSMTSMADQVTRLDGSLKRFANTAAQLVAELPDSDVTIGFGRTYAQDCHRAGGGCHAIYSRLLPFYKRLGFKNRVELGLEKKLYTGGQTREFVVNSSLVGAQLSKTYGVEPEHFSVIHNSA